MKTIVCVKVVDGEINPFDQCAIESALQIADNEVTVISMGPKSWEDVLIPVTRLGVERVILLSDSKFAGSDTLATSYVLSEAIKKLEFDLILCGRKTIDGETAQVGPCLATMLSVSVMTNVLGFSINKNCIKCQTPLGTEQSMMPALLTVERINQLRFPSIFSKLGRVEVWDNTKLNVDEKRCGYSGSPTKVIESYESIKGERRCKKIKPNELLGLIDELVGKGKKEPVIKQSDSKLKTAWVIGEEVKVIAKSIAESVVVVEKSEPEIIAEKILKQKPEVVLWNADVWGRRNAPIVAAMVNTGLCADCTELETDGKKLFMIRPAKAGNITAKIKCDTLPQMATVRTIDIKSSDIIVSAGKGVMTQINKVKVFADKLGAEFCASRGLVDCGGADYKEQVGLTGKLVSPKVYIAIGISGAVHHTVGIKDADTVIAINPDKNARIFDYSDYGIIATFDEFCEAVAM